MEAARGSSQIAVMQRIREFRKLRGVKQSHLAAAAGINQGYLSRIESGSRVPSIATLKELARALDVSPGALFDQADKERMISALLDGLTPEQQVDALNILETYVQAVKKLG